jgi:hypothetical protein
MLLLQRIFEDAARGGVGQRTEERRKDGCRGTGAQTGGREHHQEEPARRPGSKITATLERPQSASDERAAIGWASSIRISGERQSASETEKGIFRGSRSACFVT